MEKTETKEKKSLFPSRHPTPEFRCVCHVCDKSAGDVQGFTQNLPTSSSLLACVLGVVSVFFHRNSPKILLKKEAVGLPREAKHQRYRQLS